MKNQFLANSTIVIETENGELKYKKGAPVDIRVTEDGTPFVVNHSITTHTETEGDEAMTVDGKIGKVAEVDGRKMCVVDGNFYSDYKAITEKVAVKLAVFEARDPFEALVKNLSLTTEFDSKTEPQTISVSDLIVKEGISVNLVTRYLAETRDEKTESPSSLAEALKSMTSITGDNTISIPVFRRIKKEALEAKINAVKENLSKPKASENVTESRVLAIGFDADNSIDKDGYMIAMEAMTEAVSSYQSKPVIESVYKTTEGIDPEKAEFSDEYTVKDEKGEDITEAAGEGAICYTKEGKIGKLAFVNGGLVCVMTGTEGVEHSAGNGAPHPAGDYNVGDVVNKQGAGSTAPQSGKA